MGDLVFLLLTLLAFAAFVGLVALCDRIVGEADGPVPGPSEPAEEDLHVLR